MIHYVRSRLSTLMMEKRETKCRVKVTLKKNSHLFLSPPIGKVSIITYICCHLHVMLTIGAIKAEKDTGESSAAASTSKNKE